MAHGKGSLLSKMPGDRWQQFANLCVPAGLDVGPSGWPSLFMGGEIAQNGEWNHDTSVDWHLLGYPEHAGMQALVLGAQHHLPCRARPAGAGFSTGRNSPCWTSTPMIPTTACCPSCGSPPAGRPVACLAKYLTPVPRHDYRIGLPQPGRWTEILNSDNASFGGSNTLTGAVTAETPGRNDLDYSATLTLPPLGVLWLAHDPGHGATDPLGQAAAFRDHLPDLRKTLTGQHPSGDGQHGEQLIHQLPLPGQHGSGRRASTITPSFPVRRPGRQLRPGSAGRRGPIARHAGYSCSQPLSARVSGHSGISPCSGNTALRVAIIAWSTDGLGVVAGLERLELRGCSSVMYSGAARPVRRATWSCHAAGVGVPGSIGWPAASARRWVQVRGTTWTMNRRSGRVRRRIGAFREPFRAGESA